MKTAHVFDYFEGLLGFLVVANPHPRLCFKSQYKNHFDGIKFKRKQKRMYRFTSTGIEHLSFILPILEKWGRFLRFGVCLVAQSDQIGQLQDVDKWYRNDK